MNIRARLALLIDVISTEADQNPAFAAKLLEALGNSEQSPCNVKTETGPSVSSQQAHRGRRTAAVLDPITVYQEGEETLRDRLRQLDLNQLRDIVAEYSMDPDKLAMKWKSLDRIINRIIQVSKGRATKGDAFRS